MKNETTDMKCRFLWALLILCCSTPVAKSDETWIEVKSPNFIVISNDTPKQARRTARSFELFRLLMKTALPNAKVDPAAPLTVFAGRDEKSLKELLAEEHQEKGATKKAGVFVPGQERKFVALRIDIPGDEGFHVIYHEYVHMIVRQTIGDIPIWINEGLAEYYGHAKLEDGQSDLGIFSSSSLHVLQTQAMLPLQTLMSAKYDSPHYQQQEKAELFYAQSWALTHYLMIGDKGIHAKALIDYLDLVKAGTPGQEAAERAFGDLKALENNLIKYIQLAAFYQKRLSTKLEVKEDQYTARNLAPAESIGLRGELLFYLNKPERAKQMLDQALSLDPRSSRINEALGQFYIRQGNRREAEKYFTAAVELDSNSYLAQFYAGQSEMEKTGGNASAEARFRKAIAINPQFAPAYSQLSHVLRQQESTLPEALKMAQTASILEPGVLSHQLNVAAILEQMQKLDEAERAAKEILAKAGNDADRRNAESLLSHIERVREATRARELRNEKRAEAARAQTEQKNKQPKTEEEDLSQDQNETPNPAPSRPKMLRTGAPGKVKGLVKSVKCDFPAIMDMVLEASGKQQRLYAQNYYQIQFSAIGSSGKDGFEPCKELEGKKVEVEYLSTTSSQEYFGVIKTVAIESAK